ncbi:MAG: hypothetical protein MUO41_06310 [Methyloceanibacter sp.]|nr:hypothetical protein [Methyloceanibacter sp.]
MPRERKLPWLPSRAQRPGLREGRKIMQAEAAEWNQRRLDEIDQELQHAIGEEREAIVEERRLLVKDINSNPAPAPVKKTHAQLDAEIAAALAAPKHEAASAPKLTAKRAKDFRDSGNYEVRDESGALITLMFRDPESREWYEESLPGIPQTHYTERWRGLTQAEALASIAKRRRR